MTFTTLLFVFCFVSALNLNNDRDVVEDRLRQRIVDTVHPPTTFGHSITSKRFCTTMIDEFVRSNQWHRSCQGEFSRNNVASVIHAENVLRYRPGSTTMAKLNCIVTRPFRKCSYAFLSRHINLVEFTMACPLNGERFIYFAGDAPDTYAWCEEQAPWQLLDSARFMNQPARIEQAERELEYNRGQDFPNLYGSTCRDGAGPSNT